MNCLHLKKNRLNALYGSFKQSMIIHKGEIVKGVN